LKSSTISKNNILLISLLGSIKRYSYENKQTPFLKIEKKKEVINSREKAKREGQMKYSKQTRTEEREREREKSKNSEDQFRFLSFFLITRVLRIVALFLFRTHQ
jgi:hypothetical protein